MNTKRKQFHEWLIAFIDEKQIDLSEPLSHGLQAGDVVSAMLSTTDNEQTQIKKTLVEIDFKNGNVLHYLNHLATALGEQTKGNENA